MSPIPQFAKVLAKRAKAKPKVISIKPTQTKPLLRKFAKDDTELTKIRKEATRKSLERNFTKQSKEDTDLISLKLTAKELQRVDVRHLRNSDIIKYADKLKKFFEKSSRTLDLDGFVKKPLETIISLLNVPVNVDLKETEVPNSVENKMLNAVKQINETAKEGT